MNRDIRILVVDDCSDMRFLLKEFLGLYDFLNITEAKDGCGGLALVKKEQFDLIIVDIYMPYMNGIEFIKKVRSIGSYKDVPIAVISCSCSEEIEAEACRVGADNYFVKPIDFHEFVMNIKMLLLENGLNRLRRPVS